MTNPNHGNTPQATSYRPEPPQLLPTTIADGSAPGVYYRIDGELVPVLHIWLDGSVPVFFEHHVVLWKEPSLAIGIKGKGALKRMIAGMPLLLTEARGPGQVAFSATRPVMFSRCICDPVPPLRCASTNTWRRQEIWNTDSPG